MTSLAMALILEPGRREQRPSWRSNSNAGADGLLSADLTICKEMIVRGGSHISVDCAVHNPVRVEATLGNYAKYRVRITSAVYNFLGLSYFDGRKGGKLNGSRGNHVVDQKSQVHVDTARPIVRR